MIIAQISFGSPCITVKLTSLDCFCAGEGDCPSPSPCGEGIDPRSPFEAVDVPEPGLNFCLRLFISVVPDNLVELEANEGERFNSADSRLEEALARRAPFCCNNALVAFTRWFDCWDSRTDARCRGSWLGKS